MYKLFIDGEYVCDFLCPMPDWEMKRHEDAKEAYVTDDAEEPKKVAVYDFQKHGFKLLKS